MHVFKKQGFRVLSSGRDRGEGVWCVLVQPAWRPWGTKISASACWDPAVVDVWFPMWDGQIWIGSVTVRQPSAPSWWFHLDFLFFFTLKKRGFDRCSTCWLVFRSSTSSLRLSGMKTPAASWDFWPIKLHSRHLSSFSFRRIRARRSDISSWTKTDWKIFS